MTEAPHTPSVSVVVPVFNEEAVLKAFFERLAAVTDSIENCVFKVLFVDDGSRDATPRILAELAERDPRVAVVTLARNFGHQVAVTAGLDLCDSDYIIVIDADLQDPPELIADILHALQQGHDMVHMVRRDRQADSFWKRATARLFYWTMRRFAVHELPENAGDFKGFNRAVLEAVRQYRERVRFLRGIFATMGFRQTQIAYVRDARYAGRSKYPLHKVVRFAGDAILSYSFVPLRLCLLAGLFCWIGLTVFLTVYVMQRFLWHREPDAKFVALVCLTTGLSGLILVGLGIVGEYLGRIFLELKGRPLYSIQSVRNLRRECAEKHHPETAGERRAASTGSSDA